MSRADRFALVLSVLGILAAYLVHDRIFERMAHIEDEMAYVWQAQVIAHNQLTLPSPEHPKSFLVPFVIDYNSQRFAKYPLGWPALLSLGERFSIRYLVNPLLAGLGIWLIYRLSKRLFGETVGILSAGLTLVSPFFLINSGSLLSHPFGLVLSTAFALAWIEGFCRPEEPPPKNTSERWLYTITAGATLGLLILSRPMTALAIAIPFGLHGILLMFRGNRRVRLHLILIGLLALVLASFHFIWQYAVTGNFLLNPYTLWWPYDRIGFGPGFGHKVGGHTLRQAWVNTRFSLFSGRHDLFGWAGFSWIFFPLGLIALIRDRNWKALLPIAVLPCLVILYMAYWIGSSLFGPRYYYEGLYSAVILNGAGIALLASWPTKPGQPFPKYTGWQQIRPLVTTAILAILVTINLVYYTPQRLSGLRGLYGVERSHLEPFLLADAQKLAPALVIVHITHDWIEYGRLLELSNPFLDTAFIFVISRGNAENKAVAAEFPDRNVYHYYPGRDPFTFYTAPQ